MITRIENSVLLLGGSTLIQTDSEQGRQALAQQGIDEKAAQERTMAYGILQAHNRAATYGELQLRFDAMASHDITYVGIVQTARASGMTHFPVPYVLTNCHNSLCAVGGTINEDDHLFGLSAAKKYGGIYVPAHGAVIHQYMREAHAFCGGMILGSDSHTRYGALGTLSIGEGGPELVKQLLERTYDIANPPVIAVQLIGRPRPGVGPQDVALSVIGATFGDGFVKNAVLEFIGEGVSNLSMDFRIGIDVMTTETACLSSIWVTDEKTQEYFTVHGRPEAYKMLAPGELAYYDKAIVVDLDAIEPMIALPFHPSNVYSIRALQENAEDILHAVELEAQQSFGEDVAFSLTDKLIDGKLHVTQGIIAGCAGGTFENICDAASLMHGKCVGTGAFALSVYPASQPVNAALMKNGALLSLMNSGAVVKTAFCGPCFGAGDVPANNTLSIRHTTRNFPNREGSKPKDGQIASVALMDARSIAATAANAGVLTAATEFDIAYNTPRYSYDDSYYRSRVYMGFGKAQEEQDLQFGPNIVDWPSFPALPQHLILKVASVIDDPVTTTDELIPSGETSSYRSNPERLSAFTLSRKDPGYVERAKKIRLLERQRIGGNLRDAALQMMYPIPEATVSNTGIGTVIFANKPGDGSAREQAASCQKVLGGWANIAQEYATKRYRSNLINWGMLPLLTELSAADFEQGDVLFFPDIRQAIQSGAEAVTAQLIQDDKRKELSFRLGSLTRDEREIILAGCLMNYYREMQ